MSLTEKLFAKIEILPTCDDYADLLHTTLKCMREDNRTATIEDARHRCGLWTYADFFVYFVLCNRVAHEKKYIVW